jgi:serine/threonine-protein kinase RsbW
MQVEASLEGDEELVVIVRDEGRGIAPRTDSPGLGLGLPLIASLAESLELGRGEDQRTEVRMTFRLQEEPLAA